MFNRKKLAVVGAAAAMSLGLVGMGTGAQWSDQITGTEKITTGTADLRIINAFQCGGDPATVEVSPDGQSATFTAPLEDASFSFACQEIWVENAGTLNLKRAWYTVTVNGDPSLTDNVYTRINDVRDGADTGMGYATGLNGYESPGYAMPSGALTSLWFDFWTPTFLPDAAQGKTMEVTVTFHGLDGDGGTPMLSVPEARS